MTDSVSQVSLRKPDIILFSAQIFIIVVVTVVSLINLSVGYGNQNLWTVLLTSCMGIVMPNPRLKRQEDNKSLDVVSRPKNGSTVLRDAHV